MSRSMPPAALPLLAAVLVLAALPPIGVDLAPNAAASHATWLTTASLPTGRSGMGVAWTGQEALLFGGWSGFALDEIVMYVPSTDTVETMGARLPEPRAWSSAVWTGSVAYIFGGYDDDGARFFDDILRYDPAADQIAVMGASLRSPRYVTSAVWDPRDRPSDGCAGGCAYIFGGVDPTGNLDQILQYNPETDSVRTMDARLPSLQHSSSVVWTGTSAYLFGGNTDQGALSRISRYHPVTDSLTTLSAVLPSARYGTAAVWTAGVAFVVGGFTNTGPTDEIVRFAPGDPAATVHSTRLPAARQMGAAVADASNLYVIGGRTSTGDLAGIVRFPYLDDLTSPAALPSPRWASGVAWDGNAAYVLGGVVLGPIGDEQRAEEIVRYSPGTNSMTVLPTRLLPARGDAPAVSDGTYVYLFGGARFSGDRLSDILRLDPATGALTTRPATLPAGNAAASAIWDARPRPGAGCPAGCAYIFGGAGTTDAFSTILRYDPTTETVSTMGAALPVGAWGMAAAWDGASAYLFGGRNDQGTLNVILTYDPVADRLETAPVSLPGPRDFASAVWAGTHFLVMGGSTGSTVVDDILRFDPDTNELTPAGPRLAAARYQTGAVWDGQHAFVFGGLGPTGAPLADVAVTPPGGPPHPPVSIISPLRVAECENARGSVPMKGTASFDPDGTAVTHRWWSPADVVFDDATDPVTRASAPLGTTPVKLEVSDGLRTDTSTALAQVRDSFPPATTASLDGTPGNAGWWRSAVDVTLDATDRCGVDATFHAVGAGPFEEGTAVAVVEDGSHTVRYHSVDLGGNVEVSGSIPFQIDTTPPDVAILDPREGSAYVNDIEDPAEEELPTTIVVGTKTVTADAFDETSGVERVEFLVDGLPRQTVLAPGPYVFTWNAGDEVLGTHKLAARAFDVAGNDQTHEMNITTVPTTQQGVLRTADFGNACRLVLGPPQCEAVEDTIEQLDPTPTVTLLRDAINTFLRDCEKTFSPTLCGLLPDELPEDPTGARGPEPPGRGGHDAPADGAVAAGEGGGPE